MKIETKIEYPVPSFGNPMNYCDKVCVTFSWFVKRERHFRSYLINYDIPLHEAVALIDKLRSSIK